MKGHDSGTGFSSSAKRCVRQIEKRARVFTGMTRIPRLVVPGVAHHVTQRGNRRQTTFFRAFDYEIYRQLLAEQCQRESVAIWSYCLLPNHVHLIAVPPEPESLARAFGEAHRRYTLMVNRREGWTGCLWQGRFASFAMDDAHLFLAVRYLLLNPVRAGLVAHPEEWPYSSARAHLHGESDELIDAAGLSGRIADWTHLLASAPSWNERNRLRRHERNGRPVGDEGFLQQVARVTGRDLRPDCTPRSVGGLHRA